ncbi:zinc finger protein 185 isoform X11 [Paroedura picta]|uniref:zinc finger protein 185 isoform X11 n=1 Tax=Paroedura picta TaxID=143630 RepID=UPI004056A04F
MLSLSAMKDGTIVPSEEDRKKILTQMKVKTTLRNDKSWIQKKSEDEKNHSPLHSPLRSRKSNDRLSVSPNVSPLNHRAVFEELSSQAEQHSPVINKPSKKSHNTTAPSGYLIRGVFTKTVDKSAPSNGVSNGSMQSTKSASSAPGYRMSTEDYKRLAPYNVKRDTVPNNLDPPVSPIEQQKRTEAASSVLRQTAHKERSYVLSAAKKSNGSAAREAPSFMAKRVEIEDDTGPRSRSQTVPASSWINSRGKSSTTGERRSLWSDQRVSNAASTTSIDTGSRNHTSRHSSGYSSAFSHFTSLENSNKQGQEKRNQTSRDSSPSKGPPSSPKKSEKNKGKFQAPSGSEIRDSLFSEDRSYSVAGEITDPLPGERSTVPTTISSDQEVGLNRSLPSLEEQTTQEEIYENPSEAEYTKAEAHLAKSGSLCSEGSLNTAGTQTEHPETAKSVEPELERVRSNSLSMQSSVASPENQLGEPRSDMEFGSLSRRATFGSSGNIYRMASSLDNPPCHRNVWESGHRTLPYLNRQASYTSRTTCGMPSCLNSHPCNPNMSEMTHKTTPYLNNNPAFISGRSYSRDSLATTPMRSHRMPFYKDICDADAKRYLPRTDDRAAFTSGFSPAPNQFWNSSSTSGYDSDPTTSGKNFLFVKESINSSELSSSPRHNSRSLVDLSTLERQNYNGGNYLQSSPVRRPSEDICTYCGREIRNCPKIKIEKLNICCHEFCFRCGICHKPMGDLLDKIYIHRDIVHCDKCYEKLF